MARIELRNEYYSGKRILVTGGLGFLGSNLSIALDSLGAKVTILDARIPYMGANDFNIESIKDSVEVVTGDIRSREIVEHLVQSSQIIFNIAAQTSHLDSMNDPHLDADINVRGNLIILEAARELNPKVKIVFAGSRAQYGRPASVPVTEETPARPVDNYGVTKQASENYHFVYHRSYGIPVVSLRINNTYGERHQMKHNRYGIINWFIRLALDDKPITIYGDGKQLRDFNYVTDVVDAMLLSGSDDKCIGEIFNLGSGSPISLTEAAESVVRLAKEGIVEFVPWDPERQRIETGDFSADFRKFADMTNWHPKTDLETGLRRTIDFYRKHKEHYW